MMRYASMLFFLCYFYHHLLVLLFCWRIMYDVRDVGFVGDECHLISRKNFPLRWYNELRINNHFTHCICGELQALIGYIRSEKLSRVFMSSHCEMLTCIAIKISSLLFLWFMMRENYSVMWMNDDFPSIRNLTSSASFNASFMLR